MSHQSVTVQPPDVFSLSMLVERLDVAGTQWADSLISPVTELLDRGVTASKSRL